MLVHHLPQLLRAARELSFYTILSTNATLFARRHREVLPYLDWVAFPIDGPNALVHDAARPGRRGSFAAVIEALHTTRSAYPYVGIKLGTVVTRTNADAVPRIPEALSAHGIAPDTWKLYEVSPSSYAAANWDSLSLSPLIFEAALQASICAASPFGWHVEIYRDINRSGQYLFVEPNGDAMVISNGEERIVGNFFTDFTAAVAAAQPSINHQQVGANIVATYPNPPRSLIL